MAENDNQAIATELLPQRWLCLVAMIVAIFFMQFSLIIMPGIAPHIIPEMGLDPALFGMLANMPYLAGVLFGVLMGNVGDKVGIKKIMTISIVVFVIGAFWRWMSVGSYPMLMVSSLVMGFGLAVLNANSTKGIRLWFPGKAMGPAMGLYIAGASLGAGVALMVGPILGTSSSLLLAGVFSVITLVIWVACYKTHPAEDSDASGVAKGTFSQVIKNKDVWIVSFLIFFVFGNSTTFQTYMTEGLNQAAMAGGNMDALALIGTISLVSTIFVAISSVAAPAIIARFENLRPVMIAICIFEAICTVMTLVVPFGPLTWVFIILAALGLGAMLAMGKTVPALLPGIDPRNLGAVGGLQSTLQNLGGWVIAGYIIAPIAQSVYGPVQVTEMGPVFGLPTYTAIYVGAAICSILVAVCYLLLSKNVKTHIAAAGEE